jgi:hypothetical protein
VRSGADKDRQRHDHGQVAWAYGVELQKLVTGLNPGWWIISTFPRHRTAERQQLTGDGRSSTGILKGAFPRRRGIG